MKKVKIFLGVACMTVAIAAVSATKLNANFTAPEYYITNTSVCHELPETGCLTSGAIDCIVDVNGTETDKQVFDDQNCTVKLFRQP